MKSCIHIDGEMDMCIWEKYNDDKQDTIHIIINCIYGQARDEMLQHSASINVLVGEARTKISINQDE